MLMDLQLLDTTGVTISTGALKHTFLTDVKQSAKYWLLTGVSIWDMPLFK